MGTYAYTNLLLMERTARVTCTATAVAGDAVSIPYITVDGVDIYPIGYSIIDASGNFDLKQGTTTSLGAAIGITAASITAINQYSAALHPDDILVLSDGAGTATVDIRWFWPNAARDGVAVGNFYNVNLPLRTAALSAVTAEATVSIPTNAVELVIVGITNDFLYRVDNGTDDGQQVTVGSAHASYAAPYRIYVNDGDRLRIQRVASDSAIIGFWRLAS